MDLAGASGGAIELLDVPVDIAPPIRPRRADARGEARRLIVDIDRALGRQLDAVLHHPRFQRLESLWRGVAWLLDSVQGDPQVKVRLLDARWGEVARDLDRGYGFDQSILFDKVYSGEFGSPGGQPFGLVVVDHALRAKPSAEDRTDDITTLASLAEVAAAAFCPFAFSVDPAMMGLDRFGDIDLRQDLAGTVAGPDQMRLERVRTKPDTRFLAAVLPRMLGRVPYRGRDFPRLGFPYDETIGRPEDLLWMSGAFALGHVTSRAMRLHRWPADIRGAPGEEQAGVFAGPAHLFLPSDRAGVVARYATESAISEEQEVALNAAGLVCLRQLHLTGNVALLNVPTLHKPPTYSTEAAQLNARMGAMLNYILCVSRFAHYVKVIARDWVGRFADAADCERLLQEWLNRYVTANDDATPEMRVKYPLRQAQVKVFEQPGMPGVYGCEIAIRPHYQLDQIASEFRLTTRIGREALL